MNNKTRIKLIKEEISSIDDDIYNTLNQLSGLENKRKALRYSLRVMQQPLDQATDAIIKCQLN